MGTQGTPKKTIGFTPEFGDCKITAVTQNTTEAAKFEVKTGDREWQFECIGGEGKQDDMINFFREWKNKFNPIPFKGESWCTQPTMHASPSLDVNPEISYYVPPPSPTEYHSWKANWRLQMDRKTYWLVPKSSSTKD